MKENIYQTLTMKEILTIIEASPRNLPQFFDRSIVDQDKNLPMYGEPIKPGIYFKVLDKLEINYKEAK